MMEELEQAHQDYEKRRNEIRTKLECIYSNSFAKCHKITDVERKWIKQAIEFIKEKEI